MIKLYAEDPTIKKTEESKTVTKKSTWEKCHTGAPDVFSFTTQDGRRITVSAGGKNRFGHWTDCKHQPDLVVGPSMVIGFNMTRTTDWECIKPNPYLLGLNWPDMGVPSAGPNFWKLLLKDINTKKDIERIHMQCLGGHGRTGTGLAILFYLTAHDVTPFKTAADVVEHIRGLYCDHAVESEKQLQYIAKAIGLDEGKLEYWKHTTTSTTTVFDGYSTGKSQTYYNNALDQRRKALKSIFSEWGGEFADKAGEFSYRFNESRCFGASSTMVLLEMINIHSTKQHVPTWRKDPTFDY